MSTSHLIYVSNVGVDECLWLHAVPHNILPLLSPNLQCCLYLWAPSWSNTWAAKRKFVIHFLHWHFILPTNTARTTLVFATLVYIYLYSTVFGLGCSYSLFVHKLNTMSPCAMCRAGETQAELIQSTASARYDALKIQAGPAWAS